MTADGGQRRISAPAKPGAFTLVELLIVIVIVAILVTIIMPTVGRARDMVRDAICLTNHRSMVTALLAYHSQWETFPYNYAHYSPYSGNDERWALGCISPYLQGGATSQVDLRGLDEGEFPRAYVCPSADLDAIYLPNPDDKYHASYWTNISIRVNRGWRGPKNSGVSGLFCSWPDNTVYPPGWDVNSGGAARLKRCWQSNHWRSVYQPTLQSLPLPGRTVFTGCTNNTAQETLPGANGQPVPLYHATYPGEWLTRPGWGRMHGSMSFDRHNEKQLMSYLDGSARALTHQYLDDNYYWWTSSEGEKEHTGAFMLEFTANYSCGGSAIHILPAKVVE
ncbi:hypothetical protein LCGC14_2170420 [marine sediment metagenome]|uniref:Type II secretion system protein GspG C-terminal domain-containing protein n=1 Tax=marine sediment metagenome TaxID=412755 RepID=A0A0F9ECF6_9ZZZZ